MTERTDISILVPEISLNITWAATALGLALSDRYSVQIIGPDMGRGVCSTCKGLFDYTAVPLSRIYRLPDFLWQARMLADAITGRVIIAIKAYADTVPVALWKKRRDGGKVIVYLDEWDQAVLKELNPLARMGRVLRNLHHPLDQSHSPWVERLIPRADAVVSTGTFLQRRFGGSVIPLGVDTEVYRPRPKEQVDSLRAELGLSGKKIIVFGGYVRPHKGVDLILEALVRIGDPSIRLLVVGPETEHLKDLMQRPLYGPYVQCTGGQSRERMPLYLDLADLIVLPLQNNLLGQSQVPCKVFEAMAMAKPIIAAQVSDLPEILNGCGWLFPASESDALADGIRQVLSSPDEAAEAGQRARERCKERYSWKSMQNRLIGVVESLSEGSAS